MTAKLPELLLYLHNEICLSIGFVIMTIKTYHTDNNCCLQATPPPSCNNNNLAKKTRVKSDIKFWVL